MRPMRHAGRRAAALERIFLTADAAILLLDDDRITECNPAALHLFGVHRRTRLLARELAALSPPVQPDGTGSAVGMIDRQATVIVMIDVPFAPIGICMT